MVIVKRSEKLLDKWIVTEWRDGSIYKTKHLGEEWVPMNVETYKVSSDGTFYASISTKRMMELDYKTTRTRAI